MTLTIELLQNDLQILNQQKEQAFQKYHQVQGAISLLESQINHFVKIKEEEKLSEELNGIIPEKLPD